MNDKKINLLPIGSLITYKEIPLVICGYALVENEVIIPSYRVVNMPLGFIDKDSVKTIPVNREISVLKEGYKNDLYKDYINQLNHRFEVLEGLTDSDFQDIIDKLEEAEANNE